MNNQTYIGYTFKIKPLQPAMDILIAELSEIGFESFVEQEEGLEAFILKDQWHHNLLNNIYILNAKEFEIHYTFSEIENTNWNTEWEKNFQPIFVDDKVCVRAPFHQPSSLKYDIIIAPKMSFGTGHHQTTHMMIQHILNNNFANKYVLDMGAGTGVLAILAKVRGAKAVDAIDIDNWCYINSLENISLNKCTDINVLQGDSSLLKPSSYNIILANINRNILVTDMPKYAAALKPNGEIYLSGFYKEDIYIIEAEAKKYKLKLTQTLEKEQWVALKFVN